MSKQPTIEEIKQKHEIELLQIEGVEGVGIGEESGVRFIRVYVSQSARSFQQIIPQEIEGYPVRVEVSGEFRAL